LPRSAICKGLLGTTTTEIGAILDVFFLSGCGLVSRQPTPPPTRHVPVFSSGIDAADPEIVPEEEILAEGFPAEMFSNFNTPEDWAGLFGASGHR
jgi:hypothetical protein